MNRIERKFDELKKRDKKAFIGFITAGDPTINHTKELVYALEKSGTDIVEIGIPFSDPLADGPVIQNASLRAFQNGIRVKDIMSMVKEVRTNSDIPLVFLVYINTILVYGKEKFIKECIEIGVDGLVIPDLPLEERNEISSLLKDTELALIPLVAPTSKDRIKDIIDGGRGFVYCVSSLGVTGRQSDFHKDVISYLEDVKEKSHLPIAVGFGISSRQDIEDLSPYVDGVIVGSAIVRKIEEGMGDTKIVKEFIKQLIVE
jgi:tryptophan synthase alpha chain